MTSPAITIKNLDHLGLVAGMCRELGIARMVDAIVPKTYAHKVSHGEALVAMILNGLGFHSSTLHMFPQFFANKPVERLIGPGIQADDLNDDVLGRCLDALFEADVSVLYQVIAEKVVDRLGLVSSAVHLDITSFHVDGAYDMADGEQTGRLQLVRGYSRDHRPELNQVILELLCENQAGIPVYMQALSGNTNDTKAFAEMARKHIQSLKAAQQSRYLVGDAALYTAETLQQLHHQQQLFVSRVPLSIREAKQQVQALDAAALEPLGEGYFGRWLDADYAGVPQRWLLVRSEQATKREQHTLDKNLLKESTRELKAFAKLCQKRFACRADAEQALRDFESRLTLLRIEAGQCLAEPVYASAGRPKQGQEPERIDYILVGQPVTCLDRVDDAEAQTGVFILATNDLSETLTMAELLATYKAQQKVERGFRFLKSPEFLTSSLFLKKPERIEALLMVMTCSLMIYAALEHRIRQGLKAQDKSIPDMKKKPTQTPTARWVFLCFGGIHEFALGDTPPQIANLNAVHHTIIEVLGDGYRQIYS